MDAALITQVVSGAVAILSTAISLWARQRSQRLTEELKNEGALLQGVLGRTEALEMALTHANRREGEMAEQLRQFERRFHEKDLELRTLTVRYEALKENYTELAERYRGAVDELVKYYAHKTSPPTGSEHPEYSRLPRPPKLPREP